MTEQEALKYLKDANRTNDMLCILPKSDIGECLIKALEEIQQYRAIGKPKEVKQKLEELERWHTYRLAINVKNPFAKMSTSICYNCDHKDDYIEELEAEVEEYRKIGTPEECRAAVEKKEVRNKAIDDFAETCKQDVMCQTFGLHPRNIDEIAEQLKGGGVDA